MPPPIVAIVADAFQSEDFARKISTSSSCHDGTLKREGERDHFLGRKRSKVGSDRPYDMSAWRAD
jgi:hypothetical protein